MQTTGELLSARDDPQNGYVIKLFIKLKVGKSKLIACAILYP